MVAVDDHLVLLHLATEDRVVDEQQAGAVAVAVKCVRGLNCKSNANSFDDCGCAAPGSSAIDVTRHDFLNGITSFANVS